MDNQQATIAETAWLAGILDGEGWVGFSLAKDDRVKSRRTVVVKTEIQVNNCDEEIIKKATEIWLKIGVNPYRRTTRQKGIKRDIHIIATKHMTGVLKLLRVTLPYLTGNKLERAKLMIRFIKLRKQHGTIRISDKHYAGTGPRNLVTPYTTEEVEIVEKCRKLQARGASETTRGKRDKTVQDFKIRNERYRQMLMSR